MEGDRSGVAGNGVADDRGPMVTDAPQLLASVPLGVLLNVDQDLANGVKVSHGV